MTNLSKVLCILLSGKAGVGKTTTANFMRSYYKGLGYSSVVASFATGVKDTARNLGWNGVKDEKGRQLLIDIGRSGRAYDKDVWAKYTLYRYIPTLTNFPFDVVIFDDWRYPNEGNVVESDPLYHVVRVKIIAPEREILKGTPQYNDESETSLSDESTFYNAFLYNTIDGLDVLEKSAKSLADKCVNLVSTWA